MKILLTGGRGLVGRPLARLLAQDHDVHALDIEDLDVTDASAVERTFGEVHPSAVVHLAAWTDVDACEGDPARALAVNAGGTRNVADACRRLGASLLYVSTDYVFDGRKADPYVESDEPDPLSVYGRSKLEGERHVRELAPRWHVVRCQSIYGAGRKSFVDAILARAASGGALRVVADQRISPSWADDVAAALAAVLVSARPGLYHAANAGSCTWWECARAALDLSGHADLAIEAIRATELARPAPRPANSAFSCAKLETETGHAPRPWRDALAAYLQSVQVEREERP